MSDFKQVMDSLNSPADWAIVLAAGTIGLVVDGAINIIPIPFFSPGICGGIAASTALTIKRSFDAAIQHRRKKRRWSMLDEEASLCLKQLDHLENRIEFEKFRFEQRLLMDDADGIEKLIRKTREDINKPRVPIKRRINLIQGDEE